MNALLEALGDLYDAIKESLAIWKAGNEAEALERMRAAAGALRSARSETAEADAQAVKDSDDAIAEVEKDPPQG